MFRLLFLLVVAGGVALFLGLGGADKLIGPGGKLPFGLQVPDFLRPLPSLDELREMDDAARAHEFGRLKDEVGKDPVTQFDAYLTYLVDEKIVANQVEAGQYMALLSGGSLSDKLSGVIDLIGGAGKKPGSK
jgi:hypothetical protein